MTDSSPQRPPKRWTARVLLALGTLVVLASFSLYADPRVQVLVSDMIWACFQ